MALKNNKYQPTYVEGLRRYFFEYDLDPNNKGIPQMAEFAGKIGVTVRTLENWAKKHKDFGQTYEMCLDRQEMLVVNGGLSGKLNPRLVQFLLEVRAKKDRGQEKTEVVVRYERPEADGKPDEEGATYGG